MIMPLWQDLYEDDELEEFDCRPHCGSLWGFEERDWQQCDACGWPNVSEEFLSNDDESEDYDE